MTQLEQRVLATIRRRKMLIPGERAGVAVSGGADSVALLRLMESLRDRLGITLLVIHLDHRLRGAESDGDAEFVRQLADERGLQFVIERAEVSAAASKNKWNLEDAGRRLRYAFFEQLVAQGRVNRIAVAHTEDDQAETVLAHLLRGTGPKGLAGIHPEAGPVIRPLLGERRETLREYLRQAGQTWREDSTNRDIQRTRARVRERLLPMLEREFTGHATNRLAALAELAREEQVFWEGLVDGRIQASVQRNDGKLSITISDLLTPMGTAPQGSRPKMTASTERPDWQRALTERLVRRLYEDVRGRRCGLGLRHVEQVIHLARESASGSRVELPGGVVAERGFDEVVFQMPDSAERKIRGKEALSSGGYEYLIDLPIEETASVPVPVLKRRFGFKMIDWPFPERDTKREWVALDPDLLRSPLILRNWRFGDAYRPLGRRRRVKLKEMFRVRRVPTRERRDWPVLVSAGNVVWARKMPVAGDFCTREQSRRGLLIEEHCETEEPSPRIK
jgi:tRNA(Ile)-lysidine synthase